MPVYRFPVVECALRVPLAVDSGASKVSRYTRSYLIRSTSVEEAIAVIQRDVENDGADLLEVDPPELKRFGALHPLLMPRLVFGRASGIVWRSGRVFYPQDVA